jgi:N-methylhydantoinase B
MALDPTDYSVISQALIAAAREVGAKLIRAAYSTIVREANDAASAIMDADGHVVAQAELNAMQLTAISAAFAPFRDLYDLDDLLGDDFLITNHPYFGGQHLPDIFIFSPIFFDSRRIGFAATVAHHIDVGGGAPGLNMSARELYQEGLIIPPSLFNQTRDWNNGTFKRLISENIRVPDQTIGDLDAQFAGNGVGIERVRQLCSKYGPGKVCEAMAGLLEYSERRTRAAIAEAPDGVFHGEDRMDNDGITDGPVLFKVRVEISGDEIDIDFDGTSSQASTNINAPFASTIASAMTCVKSVLTASDIPFNAGTERPVNIRAPFGSILNPIPPAPVRARMVAGYRAYNCVMKALYQAVPERVISTGFDTTTGPYLSRQTAEGYRVYHEIVGGGYGASSHDDGCSGVDGPMSNCTNAPVETLDADFDYFRVTAYELIANSGGAGRYRGGLGIRRRYEILKDDVQYAQYGDRFVYQPEGLAAGEPGQHAAVYLERAGERTTLDSKTSSTLRRGDVLIVETGGGAGYGPPRERSPELIARDFADGLISVETALDSYGWIADADQ